MSGLFASFSGSVDSALNTFVVDVSSSLSAAIAPLVTAGITIWITVYGYAVMRQEVSDPINAFIKNAVKTSLILSIAISGGIYQSQIITAINGLADGLVEVTSLGKSTGGVFSVLDTLVSDGLSVATSIVMKGILNLPSGAVDILAAGVFLFSLGVLLVAIALIAIAAKIALAMVLAFGPLFISSLAFKPIAHFFDQWKNKAANYVMLMALASATATLALTIMSKYLEAMKSSDDSSPLGDVFGFALIAFILAKLVDRYLPQIAAGLTGGAALATDIFQKKSQSSQGNGGRSQSDNSGGSIEDRGRGDGGNRNSDSGNAGSSNSPARIPAYKRASMNRYRSRR